MFRSVTITSGGKLGELLQRLVAFGRRLRRHAPGVHHGRQAAALAGFVVHDQDFELLIHWFYCIVSGSFRRMKICIPRLIMHV